MIFNIEVYYKLLRQSKIKRKHNIIMNMLITLLLWFTIFACFSYCYFFKKILQICCYKYYYVQTNFLYVHCEITYTVEALYKQKIIY